MAIDRITPSNPALNIHDRQVRESPGQVHAQPVPPVAQPPGDAPDFALQSGLPAAVGALIEAMEGAQRSQVAKAAVAAGAAAGAALANETLSMQPNQLFPLRQLVWHTPDTNMLAASWQVMVRTYSEQRAALLQHNEGRHVPSSLFMADPPPPVLRDGRPYPGLPGLVSELDAWRFAVYAWGSEKLTLRVVARDPGQDGPDQRRRRPRIAVRLEMNLPDIGKVVVQMEPAEQGVVLEIGAHSNEAMQQMRELLPQIATIVGRCGLQIVRARLMRELSPVNSIENDPTRSQIALLSTAIFKAMAEVAVFLSQPRLPDEALSA